MPDWSLSATPVLRTHPNTWEVLNHYPSCITLPLILFFDLCKRTNIDPLTPFCFPELVWNLNQCLLNYPLLNHPLCNYPLLNHQLYNHPLLNQLPLYGLGNGLAGIKIVPRYYKKIFNNKSIIGFGWRRILWEWILLVISS